MIWLVRVKLVTGRSHQIRAHLASIGHPIVGDTKYGKKTAASETYKIKSQLLHSYRLEFPKLAEPFAYLSGKAMEAPLPKDFQKVISGEKLT